MATKRLDRSVLEGGRTEEYRHNRRTMNRTLRRREKFMCRQMRDMAHDEELLDEIDVQPVLPAIQWHTNKFTDKLNPIYRFLDKHHGQPWDEVWSKLTKLFDVRGLAGYHVLIQHVWDEVMPLENPNWRWRRWVDEHGTLIVERKLNKSSNKLQKASIEIAPWQRRSLARAKFERVARGRTYEYLNGRWFWMEKAKPFSEFCNDRECESHHTYRKQENGAIRRVHIRGETLKKGKRFTKHQERMYNEMVASEEAYNNSMM